MPSLSQTIRRARKKREMTLQQLAEAAGCTRGYLSQVENGKREAPPSETLLGRLEWALRLEEGELIRAARLENMPHEVRRELSELKAKKEKAGIIAKLLARSEGLDEAHQSGLLASLVRELAGESAEVPRGLERVPLSGRVPLINSVTAGYPAEFTDLDYPVRVADEYVSVPTLSDPDAFAARVIGDSMLPDYCEGDIVVFSPLETIKPGTDCFVRFERDAESTFKRTYFERDESEREQIRLQPLNPAYAARTVAREEVAGMYAAVYVLRAVGKR